MRDIFSSFAAMWRKGIIATWFLLILACSKKSPLPKDTLVNLFTDIMLLEGGNQAQYNYGNLPHAVWERDYAFVCRKHNVDTAEFRKTVEYMEAHPEEFSAVLEGVITRLQKEEVKHNSPKP